MDKVRVLGDLNGAMMREFSDRTAQRLADDLFFRLLLPAFKAFLDINVRKEVEKDRLTIATAAAALRSGREPGQKDIQLLLQQAREIDQRFLQQAAVFPVDIHIEYSDIETVRARRLERLLNAAYELFVQWDKSPRLRSAIGAMYSRDRLEVLLHEILGLYSTETRWLSRSVQIPRLLSVARDTLSEKIYAAMVEVAGELAREVSAQVFRRHPQHVHD